MTYEKALENVESSLKQLKWSGMKDAIDYVETVKTALDLQIPAEPIVDEKTDNWTCPNCFDEYSDIERHKFCPNCGQAIDWGEEKSFDECSHTYWGEEDWPDEYTG